MTAASSRVRVVKWVVQPVLVLDDGDTLTPVDVEPQHVPADALPAFAASVPDMLDHLAEQIASREDS